MKRLLPMVLICAMLINSVAFSKTVKATELGNEVENNSMEEITEEVTEAITEKVTEEITEEVTFEKTTLEVTMQEVANMEEATEISTDTMEKNETTTFSENIITEEITETISEIESINEITTTHDFIEDHMGNSIGFDVINAYASGNYDASVVVNYVLSKVGGSYTSHACLAWVRSVFTACYGYTSSACCAYKYGSSYIDSTSRDNIPLGADVFFSGSSVVCSGCGNHAGHVAIYVGDGYVVHNWSGKITKSTISYIINCGYPYRGWGWHANVALNDTPLTLDDIEVPTTTLKEGASGTEVLKLQKFLNYFMNAGLSYDSKFGPATLTAVKNFQSSYGLSVDGSVGPATRNKMTEILNAAKGIKSDTQPPTISNVSIRQNDTQMIVSFHVADDNGVDYVMLPAWLWSEPDTQETLKWGEKIYPDSNGNVSYAINISDHNNEVNRCYRIDINAYDKAGNQATERLIYYMDTEIPKITNVGVSNITSDGYTVYCTITDNNGIGKIQFPTWTDANGQDDLIWHTYTEDANTNSIVATYRVKRNEHNSEYGKYTTHIYAWDKAGNSTSGGVEVYVNQFSDYKPDDVFEYNGNIYCVYDDALDWDIADSMCKSAGGHLVTINDESENAEIIKHTKDMYYYIGLNDINSEGNFVWSDGSNSSYRNFNDGEPNNSYETEDCFVISPNGKWNDTLVKLNDYSERAQIGFILEIEKSSFNMTYSGNFKSNKYEFYSNPMPYSAAEYYAALKGGHLVTINSAEENDLIKNHISKYSWIGLNDEENEGTFKWTTGEALNYTNWNDGEPNNDNDREDNVEILSLSGLWNDCPDLSGDTSFVIEYETNKMKLELSEGKATAGGYVDIPVRISGNNGIATYTIALTYDNSIMYPVSYTKGDNFSDMISTLDSGTDMSQQKEVKFVWDSLSDISGDYSLFTIRFKIKDNVMAGTYSLGLNQTTTSFATAKLDDVDYEVILNDISVVNVLKGDVNRDGIVNGKDVVLLRQYVAGFPSAKLTSDQISIGDVTGDSLANGKDIVKIRQYIAGFPGVTL